MSLEALSHAGAARPELATQIKHMAGLLWYEMLSELNQSGLDPNALGTGGDDFQSLFLWNIAQNDFSKYDTMLTSAALRQVGGEGDMTPAAAAVPILPLILSAPEDINGTAGAITAAAAVSATPEATASASDLVTQAKNFAQTIWPGITQAAQALGVPPVAVLAQSALETGWGVSAPGHNLFGIKALDGQPATSRATHEMVDGVLTPQTASFRDYPSLAASINDYVGQIQNGYQSVLGQSTVSGFAQALALGGYATDPNYAAKLVNIAQSPLMAAVLQSLGPDGGAP